jgi:hypothetical protein
VRSKFLCHLRQSLGIAIDQDQSRNPMVGQLYGRRFTMPEAPPVINADRPEKLSCIMRCLPMPSPSNFTYGKR